MFSSSSLLKLILFEKQKNRKNKQKLYKHWRAKHSSYHERRHLVVSTKVCRIPSLNAQYVEPWSRCATAAEDHSGCRSCQLRTGNRGYNSHMPIEDWKNVAWSDESRFLPQHSDGRVRIWSKEHESMNQSCLVSMVQAGDGGVMVWDIFLAHFGPLSTNWALFKPHSLPEYCCWPCPSL